MGSWLLHSFLSFVSIVSARCAKTVFNSSRHTGVAWNCTTRSVSLWNVSLGIPICSQLPHTKQYAPCRNPERALNKCMFEKLVCLSSFAPVLSPLSQCPVHSLGSSQNYPWDITWPDTHTRSRKPYVWPHAEMKQWSIFTIPWLSPLEVPHAFP